MFQLAFISFCVYTRLLKPVETLRFICRIVVMADNRSKKKVKKKSALKKYDEGSRVGFEPGTVSTKVQHATTALTFLFSYAHAEITYQSFFLINKQ